MRYLFPLFIIATLAEIWTIIKVGEVFGAMSTIALIILTAAIGSFLLKQQGIAVINKAQKQLLKGVNPNFEIIEGTIIFVAGILLLTPGFITDIIGLLGLIPLSRYYIINYLINKIKINTTDNRTIEGEFWQDK